jgi:hypothetical protein
MQFDNQKTRNVADVVARILAGESAQTQPQQLDEELKGNQHKIDANKNNKIDAHDFKLLRAQKEKEKANSMKHGKEVKEETELEESHFKVGDKVKCKTSGMKGEVVKLDKEDGDEDDKYYTVKREDGKMKKMAPEDMTKINEESKELDEAKKGMWPGTPEYKAKHGTDREKHEAKYGKSDVKKLAPYGYRDKSEYEKAKEMKEEKSFSAMLESYKEGGLKYIATLVKEEPDNEEFTKEVADQKAKMDGKKKGGDVAKASVQAVKQEEVEELDELSKSTLGSYVKKRVKQLPAIETNYQMTPDEGGPFGAKRIKKFQKKVNKGIGRAVDRLSKEETEIQVINADVANGVEMVDIEERSLTEPEMKKKEEIVKSMKKGLKGFKERYGERAKEVMYATATARAKGD